MLLSATPLLCRCICGSRNDDLFDPTKAYGDTAHSEADFEDDPSQRRPPFTGVLSYDSTSDQPLRGAPIREGPLWLLSADEEVALVTVSLYVNGLGFKHKAQEHSYSFSPFSLVRNCKFQAITSEGVDLAEFKCFKVSMFTQAQCFYFGVKSVDDADTEEERSRWVMDVSRAMRLVTQSLFPPVQMSCEPLRNVPNTWNRLMAGYLAHHDDTETTSVLYCELHTQFEMQGRLVVYENEACEACIKDIRITARSSCCEKVGISCSCFSVDDHLFSTRTLAERKLWLRAISNVKVKVQNEAPNPTEEELKAYRSEIHAHIRANRASYDSQASMDALLRQRSRKPDFPASPFGYSEDGFFVFPSASQPPSLAPPVSESLVIGLPAAAMSSPEARFGALARNVDVEEERSDESSPGPLKDSDACGGWDVDEGIAQEGANGEAPATDPANVLFVGVVA
ncbi:unnamed protein product [Polarella glacialis]|uniref:PH domain-containing protein n=2 Tax=Polarella glacialis TaxID=89957 RepID=A0A813F274_POLGL|nr:unnamed protein product [Polarella glacialis]